jgi:hypothetical protein
MNNLARAEFYLSRSRFALGWASSRSTSKLGFVGICHTSPKRKRENRVKRAHRLRFGLVNAAKTPFPTKPRRHARTAGGPTDTPVIVRTVLKTIFAWLTR